MEVESTAPQTTLGEFLQKAREKRGFSIEYVADHLKLKISTVKALEANDYHETGGLVYVRGYLRSYAKLLNVNIDQALEQINDGSEMLTPSKSDQGTTTMPKSNNDNFALWAVGIIIILLAIAVYVWHHHHNRALEMQSAVLPATVVNTANHPQEKEPAPAPKPVEAVVASSAPAPIPVKAEATPVPNKVDASTTAVNKSDANKAEVNKAFDPNIKPSIKSFAALQSSAGPSSDSDNTSSSSNEDEEPNNNSPE
ncbi:MAG: rodZ [Gammaproteobacteria bacterium]|jgi:cytoskeleton protein RodZ|nr:rodZ [Gammaproteobacteria bacterium]